MKTFLQEHPLLRLLFTSFLLTIGAIALAGYFICTYRWMPSTVLFIESLCFLLVALCSVLGNHDFRMIDVYCAPDGRTTHLDAYNFAITIGLPGVILFFLSGVFPS